MSDQNTCPRCNKPAQRHTMRDSRGRKWHKDCVQEVLGAIYTEIDTTTDARDDEFRLAVQIPYGDYIAQRVSGFNEHGLAEWKITNNADADEQPFEYTGSAFDVLRALEDLEATPPPTDEDRLSWLRRFGGSVFAFMLVLAIILAANGGL